jgi:UDP-glucose 4-epimerase
MNILLTGGTGYIGSHAAVVLSQAGHEVVLLDNFSNSKKNVLVRLQKILSKALPCIEGDVRNTALVVKVLQEYKIDAVVHFAGLKAVGESVEKPIEYYANNVQGSISLLQAMQKVGIKTLVFSSSATVYGEPQYLPIDENHPTSTTNAYGRSKLYIEEILKDLSISDSEWKIICLRYFNPVGAHESGLIGEESNGTPNNLFPYIAKVAFGELPNLCIFGDDYETEDGAGKRDYIYIMDLAKAHFSALSFIVKNKGWHVFNIGVGVSYSVYEVISMFEESIGIKIPSIVKPRRPGDVASCFSDSRKAAELLGWKSAVSMNEICKSQIKWLANISRVSHKL